MLQEFCFKEKVQDSIIQNILLTMSLLDVIIQIILLTMPLLDVISAM
jgi:hypothetical protein